MSKTKKVVINTCYGGFGLSEKACKMLGIDSEYDHVDIDRHNKNLINVVETLGDEANGECAELKIVEIPDDVDYIIEEYDGLEWISESHRTWT